MYYISNLELLFNVRCKNETNIFVTLLANIRHKEIVDKKYGESYRIYYKIMNIFGRIFISMTINMIFNYGICTHCLQIKYDYNYKLMLRPNCLHSITVDTKAANRYIKSAQIGISNTLFNLVIKLDTLIK